MEMLYGSRGIERCLFVHLERDEDISEGGNLYQVRMLEANHIPNLLDVGVMYMDCETRLCYKTESCHVFSKRFRYSHMNGKEFTRIMQQIKDCIDTLSLYLLPPEHLVLDPEYMFYEEKTESIKMVYVPGYNKNLRVQIKELLEYMMKVFDSCDREGIGYLYSFYSQMDEDMSGIPRLNEVSSYITDVWDSNEIKDFDCIDEAIVYEKENTIIEESKEYHETFWLSRIPRHRKIVLLVLGVGILTFVGRFFLDNKNPIWLYISFVGVVALIVCCICFVPEEQEDIDEAMREYKQDSGSYAMKLEGNVDTRVRMEDIHALVPLTNGNLGEMNLGKYGEKIIIGRGKAEADYRLPMTEISRIHASIYKRGDGFFIEDLESTNGTYLNSVRIPANEIKKLNRGDIIAFANEEFFVS